MCGCLDTIRNEIAVYTVHEFMNLYSNDVRYIVCS